MNCSSVIGSLVFVWFLLCWSTFSMMTAYDRVKAESGVATGVPSLLLNQWSAKCSRTRVINGASPERKKSMVEEGLKIAVSELRSF